MIDLKVPFYSDSYINHRTYREERQKFLEEKFVGKQVEFNCELITIGGYTLHEKGSVVVIRAIDCDCFKLETLTGEPIYGLYKTSCFNLIEK